MMRETTKLFWGAILLTFTLTLAPVLTQADEIEPDDYEEVEPIEEEPPPVEEEEPEPVAEEPEENPYTRNGFYVGGNIAGAWYTDLKDDTKDQLAAIGYSLNVDLESPIGFGLKAGYRFLPFLSAEAQFQWFSNADIDFGDFDGANVETLLYTANLKAHILTGRLQPFVLAGVGLMHIDQKDKLNLGFGKKTEDFAARFAGGLDVHFTEHIGAVLEGGYVLPTGSVDGYKFVYWSVGLQYRF
jgi:opacity protein-like surface antigen